MKVRKAVCIQTVKVHVLCSGLRVASSQPLKKIAADCQNVQFYNISWLVNCTELKPDDT